MTASQVGESRIGAVDVLVSTAEGEEEEEEVEETAAQVGRGGGVVGWGVGSAWRRGSCGAGAEAHELPPSQLLLSDFAESFALHEIFLDTESDLVLQVVYGSVRSGGAHGSA